ncbi:unnamed protein product [Callosobruchus maculatus]|uniref:Uncharacterized protein n=1 Tax=Callosobruchus maculatus TaxID=64391 RepID=A0A653BWJ3_CALMS|nr:unnamed protein product [Callosobruchus maculatus]
MLPLVTTACDGNATINMDHEQNYGPVSQSKLISQLRHDMQLVPRSR